MTFAWRAWRQKGEVNPADLLTKGLGQELLNRHVSFAGVQVRPTNDDETVKKVATISGVQDGWVWPILASGPRLPRPTHSSGVLAPAVVQKLEYIGGIGTTCNNTQHNTTGRVRGGVPSLSVGVCMHRQEGTDRKEKE